MNRVKIGVRASFRPRAFVGHVAAHWRCSFRGGETSFRAQASPPTRSSPIALSTDDRFVWAVNRDNNSVSVLDVGNDLNQKVREIKVGVEPRSIAITPDNQEGLRDQHGRRDRFGHQCDDVSSDVKVIPVGTEPFGCALTPDGSKLYVANFSSDNVSVINTTTDQVIDDHRRCPPATTSRGPSRYRPTTRCT